MFALGGYQPDDRIETPGFIVRKLEARDVYADYLAAMSSIDIIKKQRGGEWPTPELTFEDDLIDLGWHQREFEAGSTFAYLVESAADHEYLACVYFYPPGHHMTESVEDVPADADAVVNFWVTQAAYDRGFYAELYRFIEGWLRDWPFSKPFLSNLLKP
jgi:hypothetical protein